MWFGMPVMYKWLAFIVVVLYNVAGNFRITSGYDQRLVRGKHRTVSLTGNIS